MLHCECSFSLRELPLLYPYFFFLYSFFRLFLRRRSLALSPNMFTPHINVVREMLEIQSRDGHLCQIALCNTHRCVKKSLFRAN